jgi:hypothetical protein
VKEKMGKTYIRPWIGNWFWPYNILKYWFTAYDRSDIMAQTFADNLFDRRFTGIDLTFADINAERPYLIINSTNGTADGFGHVFTFTEDDFVNYINSDIYSYEIARAVMASASFPAVFNYMTLYDYNKGDSYLHVFDGGNVDNLGLRSVDRLIKLNSQYKNIVVILVDAYVKSKGVDAKKYDARSGFDFLVDFNFVDSTDSLLQANRSQLIKDIAQSLNERNRQKGRHALFYHLTFCSVKDKDKDYKITLKDVEGHPQVPLYQVISDISTDFRISDDHKRAVEAAVNLLVVPENQCLMDIKSLITTGVLENQRNAFCIWPQRAEMGTCD